MAYLNIKFLSQKAKANWIKDGDENTTVITDVREKQITNAKTIKTENILTWFTNLATSTADRERIFYYEKRT